ncbi:hypothetical protein F2Q68_00017641 [Brassica cretica]|uniref:Uncharacterized protein n=1 Tax=Brassica cretica TaxID=69181 RepID=A0A8S9HM54_BRACR|nr:hypothetical protein F2Q68_00017641 [Brassica cretica]
MSEQNLWMISCIKRKISVQSFDEEKDLGPIFDEEEGLGPIFDEEEEGEAVSVLLAIQKVAKDVVDSGPEADHGKDFTTAYASGDIVGSLSSAKLVQPFVCKEYDPVELLRPEEGLQHFIFEPGINAKRGGLMLNKKLMYGFVQEGPTKKIQAKKLVVSRPMSISSFRRRSGGQRYLTRAIDCLCPSRIYDDQMYQKEDLNPVFDEEKDLGPIFDEEEEGEAVSVLLAVQKVAKDVVDSGPEADHEKDLTTAYASGDIVGSLSSAKLVQPFVCKEYDPVELLRPEEERGGLMLNKKSMYGFVQEGPTKKIQVKVV